MLKRVVWEKLCILSHITAGFLSCIAVMINPVLTVIGFILFTLYEVNQQFHKDDFFDEEMLEYGIGFFLAITILLFVVFSGILKGCFFGRV